MLLNKNFLNLKKSYIFFLITVLFLIFSSSTVKSSIFKVNNIEISEPFELNFKKEIVIDKAFRNAFKKLIKMTVTLDESKKIKNIKISEIKNLIESFNIKNEKFINNSYIANFEVNFNKQNTLLFFEKKNIFPSVPKMKKILLFPIMINLDSKNVHLFNQNPFFDAWNLNKENFHLISYLLPTEDIDVVIKINKNFDNLEDYNFFEIVKKYDTEEFIICLIYKEKKDYKIFSKIKIDDVTKIHSYTYKNIDIKNSDELNLLINEIKNIYEDKWKFINQINRSVKLSINISISSLDYKKNKKFVNFLRTTDLIPNYFIRDFNSKKLNYKIIFNGSPKQFLKIAETKDIIIDTSNQIWEVE